MALPLCRIDTSIGIFYALLRLCELLGVLTLQCAFVGVGMGLSFGLLPLRFAFGFGSGEIGFIHLKLCFGVFLHIGHGVLEKTSDLTRYDSAPPINISP